MAPSLVRHKSRFLKAEGIRGTHSTEHILPRRALNGYRSGTKIGCAVAAEQIGNTEYGNLSDRMRQDGRGLAGRLATGHQPLAARFTVIDPFLTPATTTLPPPVWRLCLNCPRAIIPDLVILAVKPQMMADVFGALPVWGIRTPVFFRLRPGCRLRVCRPAGPACALVTGDAEHPGGDRPGRLCSLCCG